MPVESLPISGIRAAGAAVGVLVIIYWTIERARGGESDPVLSMSSESDTGSASFLVSGVMAVVAVAAVVGVLVLGPGGPIVSNPAPVILMLALLVFANWIAEKEERET